MWILFYLVGSFSSQTQHQHHTKTKVKSSSTRHGIRLYRTQNLRKHRYGQATLLKTEAITNKASQIQFQTVQKVTESNTVTDPTH